MTSPAVSQRFVAALAAAVSVARASLGHSPWDEAGIAAAIRKTAETTPLTEVGIAFLRAAADPANDTPAALLQANNRAWDTDWYTPCKTHPSTRARRTNGECASCWADRNGTTEPLPLRRQGTPMPDDARVLILAAFRKPASDETTGESA